MTRLDPSVKINHLKLISKGQTAYEGVFHPGLNIIRSETNSCGKSTIMEFIFFLLGGEVAEWTDAAKDVDFGLLDVSLNGQRYTLKRERVQGEPATYIYEDELSKAERTLAGWTKYGHRRTETTKSFSQVIFEILGFPEQKAGFEANVTFNQVLRLVYCDQGTSVNKIYKDVGSFDKEIMRQSIIELLLGADDFALHEKRLQLIQKEKELTEIRGSINSLSDTLKQIYSIEEFRADWLDVQINKIEDEIEALQKEVDASAFQDKENTKKQKTNEVKELEKNLTAARTELAALKEQLSEVVFEIEDSNSFVNSLTERRSALDMAITVKETFGTIDFQFCPVCLTAVEPELQDHHCSLCKAEIKPTTKHFNRLRAKNEIDFQIRESKELLEKRKNKKFELERLISQREQQLKRFQREYNAYKNMPNQVDSETRNKLGKIGYLERQIEDLIKNKQLGNLLEAKLEAKSVLTGQISRLNDDIALLEKDRAAKWSGSIKFLEDSMREILKSDLNVQEEFARAKLIEIQFDKNKVLLDGNSKFSASSEVILKNSLFLSLFKLSCHDPDVRFPRFLMLDNVEDKGMTPERSKNFQNIIASMSAKQNVEHQIIYTTSMISEQLDDPKLCIGPKYSPTQKTLNVRQAAPPASPQGASKTSQ